MTRRTIRGQTLSKQESQREPDPPGRRVALSEHLRREIGEGARPGFVVSIATSGDVLQSSLRRDYEQWHPNGHKLTADGAFSDDGTFHPLADWAGEALMKLFRERLLARLVEKQAISQELAEKLLAWRHPGTRWPFPEFSITWD